MMLRITRMMVTKKPVAKESTKETVKPLRREGRTASAEPVCSCASLSKSCTRDRGCSAHPAFPAPLLSRAGRIWQNSGEWRRENAKSYSIFNCRRRACGDQYSRALVMESKSCVPDTRRSLSSGSPKARPGGGDDGWDVPAQGRDDRQPTR